MGFVNVMGPPQQCYEQIKDMMKRSKYESLDECFDSVICPDLGVSEVIKLYSRIKFELEEEEVIKIGSHKVDNFSMDYTSSRSRWIRQVEDFYG